MEGSFLCGWYVDVADVCGFLCGGFLWDIEELGGAGDVFGLEVFH